MPFVLCVEWDTRWGELELECGKRQSAELESFPRDIKPNRSTLLQLSVFFRFPLVSLRLNGDDFFPLSSNESTRNHLNEKVFHFEARNLLFFCPRWCCNPIDNPSRPPLLASSSTASATLWMSLAWTRAALIAQFSDKSGPERGERAKIRFACKMYE